MEKLVISVSELQNILGIGHNSVYALVKRPDFPAVRIGKRIVIPVDGLKQWLNENSTNTNSKSNRR